MQNDFCTVVVVAEEGAKQLEFFLQNYRKCHPKAPLHVISDGVNDPEYAKLCKKYKADYTLGRYYKRIECGGLWWKRTLEIGLKYNKKWILKVDPDTKFWRPFRAEPKFPVSGTHNNIGNPHEYIQGGCQAIRKDVAKKILDSGLLSSDELTKHWNFCPDKKFLNSWLPTGYFTTDFSLVYIIRKLGIEFGDWSDVGCQWRVAPPNFDGSYAVTHPHKVADHKTIGVTDETPITIITTCKGRKHHLEQTLPKWLKEKNVNVVVVDYNCPQNVGNWVEKNYPNVRVARVSNEQKFHLAKARNVGAKYAPEGWWVFMDADMVIKPGWANEVRKVLAEGYYYIASPLKWGMCGTVVVHSQDYKKAGGYDEILSGWGAEDLDFYSRLRQVNVRPAFWNGNYAENIPHSDEERVKFYDKSKETALVQNGKYVRAKNRLMVKNWKFLNLDERRALWAEIVKADKPVATTPKKGQPKVKGTHECKFEIKFECGNCGHKATARATVVCTDEDCPNNHYPCGPGVVTKPEDKCGIPAGNFNKITETTTSSTNGLETGGSRTSILTGGGARSGVVQGGEMKFGNETHFQAGTTTMGAVGTGGRSGGGGGGSGASGVVGVGGLYVPPTVTVRKPMVNISVVNHSTIDLGMSLEALCKLGMDYLGLVGQFWPGVEANLIPTKVILPNTHALIIMDDPDQNQQILGYRDLTPDGYPLAKCFAKAEMIEGVPVTTTFTHELAEFRVDPNNSKSAVNADGVVHAVEICDPVEDDEFLFNGIPVSNFVLPAWYESFHKTGATKFDYMGLLSRPFSMSPGGFTTVRASAGQWMQVHGSHPKLEQMGGRDQREHRGDVRKNQHHASTRHAHDSYLRTGRK